MEDNVCLKCKHCYEVCTVGYFRHWCKYFKLWLLPNDSNQPQQINDCAELGGTDGLN
jgi:Fe-S-cluster-containing hydrogenase component 2